MARISTTAAAQQPGLFSYAALSREGEASAREDAALIRSNASDIAKKGIEMGAALNRQKERMGHGLFMAWVRDECGLSYDVASRMMRVATGLASKFGSGQTLVGHDVSLKALDILVSDSTPQEVRDQVEALLVDGQRVTVADIRRMKAEAAGRRDRGIEEDEAITERIRRKIEDLFQRQFEIGRLLIETKARIPDQFDEWARLALHIPHDDATLLMEQAASGVRLPVDIAIDIDVRLCAEQPILAAMEDTAAHREGCSAS